MKNINHEIKRIKKPLTASPMANLNRFCSNLTELLQSGTNAALIDHLAAGDARLRTILEALTKTMEEEKEMLKYDDRRMVILQWVLMRFVGLVLKAITLIEHPERADDLKEELREMVEEHDDARKLWRAKRW